MRPKLATKMMEVLMSGRRLLATVLVLISSIAWGVTACSDEPGDKQGLNVEEQENDEDEDNDEDEENDEDAEGLQLQGELVPAGGTALGDEFTLSGHVVPGYDRKSAESESYQLQWKPSPEKEVAESPED